MRMGVAATPKKSTRFWVLPPCTVDIPPTQYGCPSPVTPTRLLKVENCPGSAATGSSSTRIGRSSSQAASRPVVP